MHHRSVGSFGVLTLVLFLDLGGVARAQVDNAKQLRRDRMKLALDAGGVAGGLFLGAVTLNPTLLVVSSGSMGVHAFQYGKHKAEGRAGATATATTNAVAPQPGALVAVPGRPGYFYDPSNPNQLYYDAASAAASVPAPAPDPMQAMIPEPARINVRIANTAKDGRTIHYTVAGTPYSVPPGYTQVLATPEGSVIAYDRGGDAGLERFTLAEGDYEFRAADPGWRFYNTAQPRAAVAKAAGPARPADAPR